MPSTLRWRRSAGASAHGHGSRGSTEPMTWSILARDPATGAFGVAVTTKFFAVGACCPHAMSGAGALATQALINPTLGPRGLRLLAEGVPATAIIETLLASDQGREMRQVHVLDATVINAEVERVEKAFQS